MFWYNVISHNSSYYFKMYIRNKKKINYELNLDDGYRRVYYTAIFVYILLFLLFSIVKCFKKFFFKKLPNLTARRLLGNRVLVLVPLSGRALAGGFRASPCAGAPHGLCVLAHAHCCRAALAYSACPGPRWSSFLGPGAWRLRIAGRAGLDAVWPGRQPAGAGCAGEGSRGRRLERGPPSASRGARGLGRRSRAGGGGAVPDRLQRAAERGPGRDVGLKGACPVGPEPAPRAQWPREAERRDPGRGARRRSSPRPGASGGRGRSASPDGVGGASSGLQAVVDPAALGERGSGGPAPGPAGERPGGFDRFPEVEGSGWRAGPAAPDGAPLGLVNSGCPGGAGATGSAGTCRVHPSLQPRSSSSLSSCCRRVGLSHVSLKAHQHVGCLI